VTDGRTDGRNCDSICALSIYAVARKNGPSTKLISAKTLVSNRCVGVSYIQC